MKPVSNKFKKAIKQYGRQIDVIITYTDSEGEHLLDSDVLFSVTPIVNGNILKSVMKQLDFESSIKVPKNTIINMKFGIQIDFTLTVAEVNKMKVERINSTAVNLLSAGLKGFEYIDFGNYTVSEEPEYNADTLSYSHVCYDKMLYSMKDYEKLEITYPITIREYINKICEYLTLTFKNNTDTFANYDKQIKLDLYEGYDYTFRDVLDELAQATASTICINESTDELEIRYLNDTQDIIDEDYLKNVNVAFSEKYGPINSIVLNRSGESDNVYLIDEQSVQDNGLCELKIIDNQIMNDNDRSNFLPDILEKLKGINYYINDFTSPGITWYELCDMYTVRIGNNQHNCVLFNDEIKITQGLEETIYTEMPTESETDYQKADKTDRKINKAYIIVDKQNQKIEALISQQTQTSSKLTQVEQTVDGISQKVENVQDVTNTVSGTNILNLGNCVEGSLLELHIYGNNTVFEYLYPSDDLYPSDELYPYGDSRIVVTDEDGTSKIYELGVTDVLRQNEEVTDEYVLKNGKAQVIRRVNTDGTTKVVEEIEELGEYCIALLNGTNIIEIQNYTAKIEAKFAIQNTYTDRFATKVEMNSKFELEAERVNIELSKKTDDTNIIASINMSTEKEEDGSQMQLRADLISLVGKILKLSDNMAIMSKNFNVDSLGHVTIGGNEDDPALIIKDSEGNEIEIVPNYIYLTFADGAWATIQKGGFGAGGVVDGASYDSIDIDGNIYDPSIRLKAINGNSTYINTSGITTPSVTQTSLEKIKKNISLYNEDVLETIKNADIYSYNLKSEENTDKKHIGFVIGDKYKTPAEVIAQSGDGIDTYAMTSILWKAVQELTKEVEELKGGQVNG